MRNEPRPSEPDANATVWYRDWEVGWEPERDAWTKSGWTAYRGGADLDAQQVDAATYEGCLDKIDETEDDS